MFGGGRIEKITVNSFKRNATSIYFRRESGFNGLFRQSPMCICGVELPCAKNRPAFGGTEKYGKDMIHPKKRMKNEG
jgi:hypothetical protein